MAEIITLDPTSEDASNVQVVVTSGNYSLTGQDWSPPILDRQRSSAALQEGARVTAGSPPNRMVKLTIDCLTYAARRDLEHKLTKFDREGGTVKRQLGDGTVGIADVLSVAGFEVDDGPVFVFGGVASATVTLECLPYLRQPPITKTLRSESTLPALVFTETGIPGDVPALGRLVVNEAQGVDQWWVIWGQQSRYYDAASSAGLFFEAEGRTAMGGSAVAAGPSGASGGGSNVMRNTSLGTNYQAILSTQATGGGAHLSHVGDFRVFARFQAPTSNTGTVSVALEWAEGDFRRWTQNATVTLDSGWRGSWLLVDLGQVHPTKVAQGTQRWEGRILAKSTIGSDDLDVDHLMLVPITEGSGEAQGVMSTASATTFTARDEFDQAAGTLNAKTLPVGGAWATSGGATDFSVSGSGVLTRSSSAGRFALAGTTTLTTQAIQVDVKFAAVGPGSLDFAGVVGRYVDASNYLNVWLRADNRVQIQMNATVGSAASGTVPVSLAAGNFYTVRMAVDAAGRVAVWVAPQGAQLGEPVVQFYSATLATGGSLASGKFGLFDISNPGPITYDNFAAWVPAADAALFASQSLEVRHDRVIRKDSGGTLWPAVSSYEGDYLRVPPAGRENRTLRMIVKACRNDPYTMADPAIDDISAQLTITPRWWQMPE